MRVLIFIAEWLITLFKKRLGILSEELKDAIERTRESEERIEQLQRDKAILDAEYQVLEIQSNKLRDEIDVLIDMTKKAREDRVQVTKELKDYIDSLPDEDVIRL